MKMSLPLTLRIVTLSLTLTLSGTQDSYEIKPDTECPFEECDCFKPRIDCANKNLTEIPELKAGTFTDYTLDISMNQIERINASQLPAKLQSFMCLFCPSLLEIQDGAFADSKDTLDEFIVSDSPMTTLPTDLSQLTLKSFSWTSGKVKDPATKFSEALKSSKDTLEVLNLNNNSLTRIPEVVANMKKLTNLWLDENGITISPINSGKDYFPESLQRLDLNENSLNAIPSQIPKMAKLSHLSLSENKITDLVKFTLPSSLKTLEIMSNKIPKIPSQIKFKDDKSKLETLLLTANPITEIALDAFDQLIDLKMLGLSVTKLTRLPLAVLSLKNLTDLNLNMNPNMTCACEDKEMVEWYMTRDMYLTGGCDNGKLIVDFLTNLKEDCKPKPKLGSSGNIPQFRVMNLVLGLALFFCCFWI